MTRRTETRVMMVTTGGAFVGTQPVASHHGRSTVEDAVETTTIYLTSSTPEMHVVKSKADSVIESVKSMNSVMKKTMIITVLTTTNLTGNGHWKQDIL
jgi:hypothetical protein